MEAEKQAGQRQQKKDMRCGGKETEEESGGADCNNEMLDCATLKDSLSWKSGVRRLDM